jgi:hypothetical protein
MQSLPADLQEQYMRQEAMKEMAQALLGQSLTPGTGPIRAGNVAAADWSVLAKPFQAWAGRSAMDDAISGQAKAGEEYQRRYARELAELYQGMNPTQSVEKTDTGGAPYQLETQMPDVRGNLARATGSSLPAIRDIAQKLYDKQTMSADEMLRAAATGNVDPRGLAAAQADPRQFGNIRTKAHTVESEGAFKQLDPFSRGAGAVQTFDQPTDPTTGLRVNKGLVTGKETSIGVGGSATPPNVLRKEVERLSLEGIGKDFKEVFQAGKDSLRNIAQIQANLEQIPEGKFGVLGEFRNTLGKLVGQMNGKQDFSTIAMEGLISGAGHEMLKNIRLVAPVTEKDVTMMQAIIGSASNTKAAFAGIIDYLGKRTMENMDDYSKRVEAFAGKPGAFSSPEEAQWFKDYYSPGFTVTGTAIPNPAAGAGPMKFDRQGNPVK